ncbi:signal peptidase I [Kordia zhangzhouensis]|uniref:signal peptidase I n=1 Tax=Kordia zhangzhouensis TaxID=1620405 RepID=UPI000A961926|nr:signal peptidase I [Kordia zhangzhouensis]
MNKTLKIVFIIAVSLVAVVFLLNKTGMYAFYSIPTTGNEPNIKYHDFIAVSNLITPKRGDFVSYVFDCPTYGKVSQIHRLCGVENDTIQITNGELFVNGKSFDKNYNLLHAYLLDKAQYKLLQDPTIEYFPISSDKGDDLLLTFVEDVDARNFNLHTARYRDLKTIPNPRIKEIYQQPWNKDHFGPLIIPKGKIFVLGDNRDNSIDSRILGLIDTNALTGVYQNTLFNLK